MLGAENLNRELKKVPVFRLADEMEVRMDLQFGHSPFRQDPNMLSRRLRGDGPKEMSVFVLAAAKSNPHLCYLGRQVLR
jgi:hypothetical protein